MVRVIWIGSVRIRQKIPFVIMALVYVRVKLSAEATNVFLLKLILHAIQTTLLGLHPGVDQLLVVVAAEQLKTTTVLV